MYGSHLSIAGGLHRALLEAESLGLDTVQVFTKNQQQWKVRPLGADALAPWKAERRRLGFGHVVSHDSYLINLASPDEVLWRRSIGLFEEELRRCALLGIPFLVAHPGAHMGSGEEAGLRRVAEALDLVHARVPARGVTTCLETTAGQGTSLGHRLEHLETILALARSRRRVGVCLDTAHLFAAGYDFRARKYPALIREIDRRVGLARVRVLHLNDSKKPLGSRVDRHEHIGLGAIGVEGFRPFVRDRRWRDVPKILETPKGLHPDGRPWDAVNLDVLRGLA